MTGLYKQVCKDTSHTDKQIQITALQKQNNNTIQRVRQNKQKKKKLPAKQKSESKAERNT